MFFLSRLPAFVFAHTLTSLEANRMIHSVLTYPGDAAVLRQVLIKIDAFLMTAEHIRVLLPEVLLHANLADLFEALENAESNDLLEEVDSFANVRAIIGHQDSKGVERCLAELQFAALLSGESAASNRHVVETCQNPWDLASVLIVLQKTNLLTQRRFDEIARHGHLNDLYQRLSELVLSSAPLTAAIFQRELRLEVTVLPSSDWVSGRSNLEQLAADNESSTRMLSSGEELRLSGVTAHYQPKMIEWGGAEACFQGVRQALAACYEENPARDQVGTALPLAWEDFKALDKQGEEYTLACHAYYQHQVHTAYRYLSKPNPWIAADAVFVCQASEAERALVSSNRWANFEHYKRLIGTLFLAVIDEEMFPTDDHTYETRKTHFFNELALIGRAHNWDQMREKRDSEGAVLFDENNQPILEYYDDGEGDKPSCDRGVRARLYQSVLGHRLFNAPTLAIIKLELTEFMRAHLQQKITEANRRELHQAWRAIIALDDTDEHMASLAMLNVSREEQVEFERYLSQKYPSFYDDRDLLDYVTESFTCNTVFPVHALRFAGEVGLAHMLTAITLSSQAACSFFSRSSDDRSLEDGPVSVSRSGPGLQVFRS